MEPTGKIYELLPKVMDEIGAVGKGRKANMPGGAYMFRGIDDLYNAVQPALIKHGVTVIPAEMELLRRDIIERQGKSALIFTMVQATYRFTAPDGSSVTATTIGEAMDTGDKGCNKAMSTAMKYALFQVLCIPTEESKDPENDHHELPPAAPAKMAPAPVKQPPKAAAHPNAIALTALCNKWAKVMNVGEIDKLKFVEWCKVELGTDVNLASPANWDAEAIGLIGEALNQAEGVAA